MNVEDRAYETLCNDMVNRNVVTEEEFAEFLPLFSTAIQDNQYTQEFLSELITKYTNRFTQTLPISIVNNKKEVVKTIPPMFVSIPAINKTIKHSNELVTAHTNITLSKSQPIQKKMLIRETYKKAVELTIENDPTYKKSKDVSLRLSEQNDNAVKKEIPNRSTGSTDGMEWN